MNQVYLACYHGRASRLSHRICDGITKFFTKGGYSHCEIAISLSDGRYQCYSSSYRDGGVRTKTMRLSSDKWDLLALDGLPAARIEDYFAQTKEAGYDLFGALGCVAGLRQHADRYFCSEWCFNVIFGSNQGWRFSPNQLAQIACHLGHIGE
ncbi:enoyl-CoA hydratase [Moraxella nasibovis]|uniref:enoyl-CoA hydratase n=1 Tax=Moraxella nasibovis TaxID=2904120 RepID=UPI002410B184|nr:enoyl-CoA hydratase [Moraxella nasibovis]WFF38034.1 enoyl-CoA hydratase [Moraxella nasibovis]